MTLQPNFPLAAPSFSGKSKPPSRIQIGGEIQRSSSPFPPRLRSIPKVQLRVEEDGNDNCGWKRMGTTEPKGDGPSAELAVVGLVLGNDDLLAEIFLCLDFATWLVRAALVCRRWLRHASDPAFLRRFRAVHPPRILSLRVQICSSAPLFLPVSQPQELAAAARYALVTMGRSMPFLDCRNGRLLIRVDDWRGNPYAIRSLLLPVPDAPLPTPPPHRSFYSGYRSSNMFLLGGDGGSTSCLSLTLNINMPNARVEFSILQAGVWSGMQSTMTELETVSGENLPYRHARS